MYTWKDSPHISNANCTKYVCTTGLGSELNTAAHFTHGGFSKSFDELIIMGFTRARKRQVSFSIIRLAVTDSVKLKAEPRFPQSVMGPREGTRRAGGLPGAHIDVPTLASEALEAIKESRTRCPDPCSADTRLFTFGP